MRQDCNLATMKEIKQSILDMPLLSAQFINSISQIIGCRSSEFVTQLGQKLDPSAAVSPCLLVRSAEVVKPIDHGGPAIGFLVERNVCSRHILFMDQIITILI